jgi:hypothetical protein
MALARRAQKLDVVGTLTGLHVPTERRQKADAPCAEANVLNDPRVARQPDDVAGENLVDAQLRVPRGNLF